MGCPLWVQFLIDISHHTGSPQQTPYSSPTRTTHGTPPASSNSDSCITSLQDPHSRHPMNRPWRQHMRCPLWVQILINISDHYGIFTTDAPWPTHKGNSCGVPREFTSWFIYITTGSSQLTHHGSHPWGAPYEFNVLHHYRPFLLALLHLVIFSCDSILDMFNFMDFL